MSRIKMSPTFHSLIFLLIIGVYSVHGQSISTTVIVQEENGCKSYYEPQQWTIQTDDVNVRSQSNQFYKSNENCIAILKGKDMYQWEVTITQLNVDGKAIIQNGIPKKCHDFVKLYNGPRVDNARLIPHMPISGLCWKTSSLPNQLLHFKTSQKYLTIQFKTDEIFEGMEGFTMTLRQYKWTNNPNPYPNPGGWNDGTLNEFQQIWDSQPVVPGESGPGYDYSDYDTDPYGATCYECELCKLDNFDPKISNAATKSGCYTCSKEWDDEYAQARRKCYSQRDYKNLLVSYGEQATDSEGKLIPVLGCHKFINDYGRGINYCFCETDYCNSSDRSHISYFSVLVSIFISTLYICKQ